MMKMYFVAAGVAALAQVARAAASTYTLPDITISSLEQSSTYSYNGTNHTSVLAKVGTFAAAAGTVTVPAYAVGDTFVQRFVAPAGMRFVFHLTPPSGGSSSGGGVYAEADWFGSSEFGARIWQTPSSVTVDGLRGSGISQSAYCLGEVNGNARGRFVYPAATLDIAADSELSFTGLTVSMPVPAGSAGGIAGMMTLGNVRFNEQYSSLFDGPPYPYDATFAPVLTLQPMPEPASVTVLAILGLIGFLRSRPLQVGAPTCADRRR